MNDIYNLDHNENYDTDEGSVSSVRWEEIMQALI